MENEELSRIEIIRCAKAAIKRVYNKTPRSMRISFPDFDKFKYNLCFGDSDCGYFPQGHEKFAEYLKNWCEDKSSVAYFINANIKYVVVRGANLHDGFWDILLQIDYESLCNIG